MKSALDLLALQYAADAIAVQTICPKGAMAPLSVMFSSIASVLISPILSAYPADSNAANPAPTADPNKRAFIRML